MARKSRFTEQTTAACAAKRWQAALYIRLSREDGDKEESDSVQNQRSLLRAYLENEPELTLADVYVDDGYTGTNFDRPGFSRMMEKIRQKQINCVIVKDLSRFGRNYIEVGKYIEQIFPFLDVRFISVGDMLDSYKNPQAMNNLIVPFKNIINDEYCRDISNKVRSSLDMKRKRGDFIGSFACYGYRKDPDNKNRLLADEPAAQTVRDIYRWFLSGMSILGITRKLNSLGVPSPAAYKQLAGLNYHSPSNARGGALWHDRTVRRILQNQMYIGNLVQGVNRVRSYKVQKAAGVPQEDWIVVENTHEPIVERADFDKAQNLLGRDTRTAPGSDQLSLFSGFLRCADCNRAMVKKRISQPCRDYIYYHCAAYKKTAGSACTRHTIRADELETAVLQSIQKQVELAVEMDQLIDAINRSPGGKRQSGRLEAALADARRELARMEAIKQSLYEDWKAGDITREEYHAMKPDYQARAGQLSETISRLEQEQRQASNGLDSQNAFLKSFLRHRNIQTLTREILVELVDCILVHEGKQITIRFKFTDEYQKASDYIRENHPGLLPGGHDKTA
ncbi:recombinase family protein [Anaerotruncus rubiinfantis]|uniref:recombinase family protein n=1 Tax=Anaerotruncus rubiinfantis TaxID=1720200 RepID=UPI0018977C0D|nr:recombinase family protein [Anaerotruncus rubiinfantis]